MIKMIETQKGRFLIRLYQPEDKERILSLWKAAFGRGRRYKKVLQKTFDRQTVMCLKKFKH
jgi:hypothetical protein